jgi:parallel beta-helix repeat protein
MKLLTFSPNGLVPRLAVLLLALRSVNAQETTTSTISALFVVANGIGTSCSSLDDACGSIQTAVNVAREGAVIQIGPGTYVENIQITTAYLTLVANTDSATEEEEGGLAILESAGGIAGVEVPEDVPVDILLDIQAPNTTIMGLMMRHPEGPAIHRDIGIYVRPSASHTRLENLVVERLRTGYQLEPYTPGSRGLLVMNATHVSCLRSTFRGNYQDHIHLPTSFSLIEANVVANATRLGIVIIQEESSDNNDDDTPRAIHNWIKGNTVVGSASDGIQVQGNNNTLQDNTVSMNGGYGIHFCGGPDSNPPCVAPGESSHAASNSAVGNFFWDNAMGGEYAQDQGTDNYLGQAHETSYEHQNTFAAVTGWPTLPPWGYNNTGDDLPSNLSTTTASEIGKVQNGAGTTTASTVSGDVSMLGSRGSLGCLLGGTMVSLLSSFSW